MLKLQKHSYLTESILKTLKQNRITTLLDFLQEDAEKLSNLTKLALPQVLEIRNEFFSRHCAPLISGTLLLNHNLTNRNFIATGVTSLDTILGNGIPVGLITEVCGLAGCGKSQLCMQIAINVVKDSEDTVLYIDTKGDFSAIRIQKILDAQGFSHKEMAKVMLKIKIVRIWNMDELIKFLENLKAYVYKMDKLSLIIVDSLPCLMFQHFGDDNKLGLTFLNRVVNCSRYLSKLLKLGFLFVNIQTRWIDNDVSDPEDTESTARDNYVEKRNRCLGKYWESIPAILITLEKNSDCISNNQNVNTSLINVAVKRHLNPSLVQSCILWVDDKGVQ